MSQLSGRGGLSGLSVLVGAFALASCSASDRKDNEFRMVTESFNIRVMVDPAPPKSLEQITWTVVVNDRETGRPIDGGEGRVFASNRDGHNIANGFAPTEQVGTYKTQLLFVTAGSWAMGIQFRRDSTQLLERTHDWMQDVRSADEPGEYTLPSSAPYEAPTVSGDSVRPDSVPPDSTSSEDAAAPR